MASASFFSDTSAFESYEAIGRLKEYVRRMLVEETTSSKEKMNLIDSIHRHGLSFHFSKEIDGQLEKLFCGVHYEEYENYDLYTVSLHFRVFRQHGYKMSSDVFNKFKDNAGKFQDTLASDVKGMLSFNEAAILRIRGEDSLDEALAITTAPTPTPSSSKLDPTREQLMEELGRLKNLVRKLIEENEQRKEKEREQSRRQFEQMMSQRGPSWDPPPMGFIPSGGMFSLDTGMFPTQMQSQHQFYLHQYQQQLNSGQSSAFPNNGRNNVGSGGTYGTFMKLLNGGGAGGWAGGGN